MLEVLATTQGASDGRKTCHMAGTNFMLDHRALDGALGNCRNQNRTQTVVGVPKTQTTRKALLRIEVYVNSMYVSQNHFPQGYLLIR
jgi:hypothetical protein